MTVEGSDSNSLALPSTEDAYVLVVETFHSKNRVRKDPRKLPGFKELSTHLRVITVRFFPLFFSVAGIHHNSQTSRPNDVKSFPDFQTFTVSVCSFPFQLFTLKALS